MDCIFGKSRSRNERIVEVYYPKKKKIVELIFEVTASGIRGGGTGIERICLNEARSVCGL
jgi:hypothetical protein